MRLFLSAEESLRLNNLKSRYESLNDYEEQELSLLRRKNLALQEARIQELADVKAKVSALNIDIMELFTPAAIVTAVRDHKLIPNVGGSSPVAIKTEKKVRNEREARPSDAAPILFDFKVVGTKGRAFIYRQGRIYEAFSATVPTAFPYVKTNPKFLDAAQSYDGLAPFLTETGRIYFATPEGQKELNDIFAFVQTARHKIASM
jgi:hypothetical protein